jgi:hypothetical protein
VHMANDWLIGMYEIDISEVKDGYKCRG